MHPSILKGMQTPLVFFTEEVKNDEIKVNNAGYEMICMGVKRSGSIK